MSTEVPSQFQLTTVLEVLLFSTSEPITVKDIQGVFSRFHDEAEKVRGKLSQENEEGGSSVMESRLPFPIELIDEVPALVTSTQIRDGIDAINNRLDLSKGNYRIQESNNGFRMIVSPENGFWVRLLKEGPKPIRLSQPAMETMAIIAYRQPVTRSEMESIRGVSVDSSLQKLVEHELVYVMGRAELPGRPVQYGTTDKFLEFTGVTSLEELPSTDVLSPQQLDEWIKKAEEPDQVGDEEVGLLSNDDENVENQATSVKSDEDQEELGLESEDDPVLKLPETEVEDEESEGDEEVIEDEPTAEPVIEEVADEEEEPQAEKE